MASNPPSAFVQILKQFAAVVAASYLGASCGLCLYILLRGFGFQFQEIAGHLSMYFFAGEIVAPVVSVFACILVSRYFDHARPTKIGILLALIASYFGVDVELRILDAAGSSFLPLWPAIVGGYSFLGYQAGLVVGRRWLSQKRR